MKKLLLSLAMMAFGSFAFAQLTIIPKAGITLSSIAAEEDEDIKSKLGFNVGVGFNIAMSDMFSFQPELQFIQKGYKIKISENDLGFEYTIDANTAINYLEVPVLVKASFGSDNLKFFFNGGPSIGLGLGGKMKGESRLTYQGSTEKEEFDGKVKFGEAPENSGDEAVYFDNRIDFGLQVGAGVIVGKKITFDIRYGLGLSNLVDKEDGMTDAEAKSQNRVFQFTVGIPLVIN